MRILVFSLGTRGDFEIFLTLAQSLAASGQAVTLASSPFYRPRPSDWNGPWLDVGTGTQAELVAAIRGLAQTADTRERVRLYAERWVRPQLAAGLPQLKAAAQETDYFINNLRSVWQRGGQTIPGAEVTYDPPADVERLAGYASQQPSIAASIAQIVAMPAALVDPDHRWGEGYHFTGFWQSRSSTEPLHSEVETFLQAGPPPVVLTMGSMVLFDPPRLIAALAEALDQTGQRGVVITSWAGSPGDVPASQRLFLAPEIPYDRLLPRAACVLHHGGCGTVAAVLRAGRPSILLPQISSQEHFGRLLERQNLVAGVLDAERPAARELAAAIDRALRDPAIGQAARQWQARVAQEPGVASAVEAIERHARGLGLNV